MRPATGHKDSRLVGLSSLSLENKPGVSLRISVVASLREAIIEGTLPPGSRVLEEEIASVLGVSRNPVREAFRALEQEGWLVAYAGTGVYVADPTPEEVLDLFDVRAVLEALAARLAAKRASPPRLAQLTELLAEGKGLARRNDTSALVNLNDAFHYLVAEGSGNRELMRLLPAMSDRIRWHFSAVAGERALQSWTEHEELIEAIAARDGERAAYMGLAHVERTRDAYARFIARTSEGVANDPDR